MKAVLRNYHQAPRKVRLIADLIRGKKVNDALQTLKFVEKRAAEPFAKVIKSAVANAEAQGKDIEHLKIKQVVVDKGIVMKRYMPRARGSASKINRRTSHIVVELG